MGDLIFPILNVNQPHVYPSRKSVSSPEALTIPDQQYFFPARLFYLLF